MKTLQNKLKVAFEKYKLNPALEIAGDILTYSELYEKSLQIAQAIEKQAPCEKFIGIFASRSVAAYSGLAGTVLAGKAYLPINPKFPPDRIFEIISTAKCRCIVLGRGCLETFGNFLEKYHKVLNLTIIFLSENEEEILNSTDKLNRHTLINSSQILANYKRLQKAGPHDYAYLLFTSGSTGTPKGIGITHCNICTYMEYILSHYDYKSSDRISQAFDLTFDPSVHDIFSAWLSGACLCVVPTSAIFAPARFIQDQKLTIWYSVPSVPMFMDKLNMLKDNMFPNLRYSIFSGEALSQAIAQRWQNAAPNSLLVNFYGPTEVTINITFYHWDNSLSPQQCLNGAVPLGNILSGHEARIINSNEEILPIGKKGELIISGPQVAPGYLNNEQKTSSTFKTLSYEKDKKWYFTGDIVEIDKETGLLYYFGRKDFQIQVLGHRVELAEIEAVLQKATSNQFVTVLPWPIDAQNGRADEIIAVIGCAKDSEISKKALLACKNTLPSYMVPSKIFFLEEFPLNVNGKIDRKALANFVTMQVKP